MPVTTGDQERACSSSTEDGRATETMARYYERFARGGFGLVISEGIYTDQVFSQGYVFQPGISAVTRVMGATPSRFLSTAFYINQRGKWGFHVDLQSSVVSDAAMGSR